MENVPFVKYYSSDTETGVLPPWRYRNFMKPHKKNLVPSMAVKSLCQFQNSNYWI